jgi:hypothetical protein
MNLRREAQFTLAAAVEAGILVRAHSKKGEGILRDRIGHAEIPVVEDVVGLDAELQLVLLGDVDHLIERKVDQVEWRPA